MSPNTKLVETVARLRGLLEKATSPDSGWEDIDEAYNGIVKELPTLLDALEAPKSGEVG